MTTILIVLIVLFVLGGGGWGYSRWRGVAPACHLTREVKQGTGGLSRPPVIWLCEALNGDQPSPEIPKNRVPRVQTPWVTSGAQRR